MAANHSGIFALRSLSCVCIVGAIGACGSNRAASPAPARTVTLTLAEGAGVDGAGLSDDGAPAFLGLTVIGPDGKRQSHALTPGENALELPLGRVELRAAYLSSPSDGTGGGTGASLSASYATATAVQVVDSDTSELTLAFSPAQRVPSHNVYGLVHLDTDTPASGASVTLREPHTGMLLKNGSAAGLASAGTHGEFAFRGFFPWSTGSGTLDVVVIHGGRERRVSMSMPTPSSALLGTTLPSINLASADGRGVVKPTFARSDDWDLDGLRNDLEFSLGTNPFSELSGAQGYSVVMEGPFDATACGGAGGYRNRYFSDTDRNGVVSSGDTPLGGEQLVCNGSEAAKSALTVKFVNTVNPDKRYPLVEGMNSSFLSLPSGMKLEMMLAGATFKVMLPYGVYFATVDCTGTAYSPSPFDADRVFASTQLNVPAGQFAKVSPNSTSITYNSYLMGSSCYTTMPIETTMFPFVGHSEPGLSALDLNDQRFILSAVN